MTILLVDDEEDILEGMLAGIDFEALDITRVYTATSAQEAREILHRQQVDILLTDIEMPGENGLKLLEWLCREGLQTVTMFCTNFANFDYAQKAVELHSFDYYLKPIAYEDLQEHLSAAVEEVRKNHSASAYRQMGNYWLRGQKDNRYAFWDNLLTAATPLPEVLRNSAENGLTYDGRAAFTLCYIHIMDQEAKKLEEWKVYGFRNIAEEYSTGEDVSLDTMLSVNGQWLAVLHEKGKDGQPALHAALSALLTQAGEIFHVYANAYLLHRVTLSQARSAFQDLVQAAAQDVLRDCPLVDVARFTPPENNYSSDVIAGWAELLTAGQIGEIMSRASALLERHRSTRTLSVGFLKALRTDMQQLAFAELDRRGANAHTLFNNARYEELLAWSLDSVDRFQIYFSYLLQRTEEQIHFTSQADTVVGRVKSYVQEHLSEDINRATVAKQFFLNPDYLARLFKRETGQTLGTFLQEQRILEAKKLLCQPGLPISEIAQLVGYDNYSYFSHFFHEKTGMSPSQFRKSFGPQITPLPPPA